MSNITNRRIWGVAVLALICLLLLQFLWLQYSYKMQKQELQEILSRILSSSVDKELDIRYDKYFGHEKMIYEPNPQIDSSKVKWKMTFNQEEMKEASPFQQILNFIDKPLDIIVLDSIFGSELEKSDIKADYALFYTDSIGNRIESAGALKKIDGEGLIKTDSFLIVDGKRVEAVVDLAVPVVLKRMFMILILSLLVALFLVFLFYNQTKTLFTEQKLSRLRTDFVHALIHNFKSPLNTVALKLSYMKAGRYPTEETRNAAIQEAIETNGKVLKLAEKTLIMARSEGKRLTLNRQEIDVNALIAKIVHEYKDYPKKKVFFKINASMPNITADMDSELMEDVLRNLIDNALKYSGDPVHIEIHCDINDHQMIIGVQDDGDGISPQAQTKIMHQFERGDAVGRKDVTGFGLGLYYVKQVVEAHGGNVMLESETGKGTTVSLLMPLKASWMDDLQSNEIERENTNDTVIVDRR